MPEPWQAAAKPSRKRLVLIDAETGHYLGNEVGHLVSNLEASGYKPFQIDAIAYEALRPGDRNAIAYLGRSDIGPRDPITPLRTVKSRFLEASRFDYRDLLVCSRI